MRRVIRGGFGLLMAMILIAGLVPAGVSAAARPSVSYRTHVENEGWQNFAADGNTSGTSGKGYRLEGIEVKLDTQGYNLGITYQTHIQNIGWESETSRGWKSNGVMSGTEGLGYRLEAIQIKLTGKDAGQFDIYYQVHAQNMGWLGWAKNGESAGTAGYGYRLEAIRIMAVPKGSAAPEGTVDQAKSFYENLTAQYAQVIEEYRIAENNICDDGIIDRLNYVNPYVLNIKGHFAYTIEDFSGDSIPELVISAFWGDIGYPSNEAIIYDFYWIRDGKPERIFKPENMRRGSIVNYKICEQNIIRISEEKNVEYWNLEGNSYLNWHKTIRFDGVNFRLYDESHNGSIISTDEATAIKKSYVPRSDINWIAIQPL